MRTLPNLRYRIQLRENYEQNMKNTYIVHGLHGKSVDDDLITIF